MQAIARLEPLQARDRRSAPRRKLSLGAAMGGEGDPAVILDLSTTGILIETSAALATSEQLHLELPEAGRTVATIVWNSGPYFGCEFKAPIPQAAISAALLRNPITPSAHSEDESEDSATAEDDRFSFSVRLRVIFGTTLMLWALILWSVGVL